MIQGKFSVWLSAAALALGALLSADMVLAAWLPATPHLRAVLVVLDLAIAVTAVASCLGAVRWRQEAGLRHIEGLCRLDHHALLSDARIAELPSVPQHGAWHELAVKTRDALRKQAARLMDLEQARAAQEVRVRRNEARMERIEAILAGITDPVLAIDAYDELVLANPAAEKLFNLSLKSGNPEHRQMRKLLRCAPLADLLADMRRRKTLSQRHHELEIAGPDEKPRWYSVTTRNILLQDENGGDSAAESQGAVAVLRDISTQRAIQQRNAEFVSAVSHEMKTPLAGIKAYTELLIDGDADDEATRGEFLGVIAEQSNRLQRLVDNLLNLARIEAGVVAVSKRSQSLNELLEEAFRVVHPAAAAKQIRLHSELSSMYIGVLADRDMLLQAAINLLSNAVKYTPEGGSVTLRSRLSEGEVRFEVEDTGVGLTPEDCQKVFEKFYRVEKNKKMAAGTGLGLPLAKHIVEDVHGGRLSVASVLGQGCTFTITMPSAGQTA